MSKHLHDATHDMVCKFISCLNIYKKIIDYFAQIVKIPISDTFDNTMESIILTLTKLKIVFNKICNYSFKLSNYAVRQTSLNEKTLTVLSIIIENNKYNMMYEKYANELSNYDNIIKFKSIISTDSFFKKYIGPEYQNIDDYTITIFNEQLVPGYNMKSKTYIPITKKQCNYIGLLNIYLRKFITEERYSDRYKYDVARLLINGIGTYHDSKYCMDYSEEYYCPFMMSYIAEDIYKYIMALAYGEILKNSGKFLVYK